MWFLNGFGMVEDADASLLAVIGGAVCWIFAPLGFGTWQATVTTITGLIAKEEVVGTLGVLYEGNLTAAMGTVFTGLTAYSFMIFNLLCAPCFAAMGAIKREMNNARWTFAAIGYMCLWAYVLALIVYQIGGVILGEVTFGIGTIVGIALLVGIFYMLFRRGYQGEEQFHRLSSVAAAAAK